MAASRVGPLRRPAGGANVTRGRSLRFPSAARSADARGVLSGSRLACNQLLHPPLDCVGGHPQGLAHNRDAATTQLNGLGRSPVTSLEFIQRSAGQSELLLELTDDVVPAHG